MDQTLYQIFKIILCILARKMKNCLLILQYKYVLTNKEAELHLLLRLDVILSF